MVAVLLSGLRPEGETMTFYLTGQCIPCNRRFRWEADPFSKGRLKVEEAVCLGCDGPLTDSRVGCVGVENVDSEWVRSPKLTEVAELRRLALEGL